MARDTFLSDRHAGKSYLTEWRVGDQTPAVEVMFDPREDE